MGLVALVILIVALLVALAALWPPIWAPPAWRRWTRPFRHRVRRRYYGNMS